MAVRRKKINLNWLETLEEGFNAAKLNNKKVLVFFTGSDWCPWCVGLYEYCMNNQQFAEFATENLNLVMLDFPKKNELTEERKKYCTATFEHYKLSGLPTVLLFDTQNKLLGQTGYHDGFDGPAFVNELKEIISGIKKNENAKK